MTSPDFSPYVDLTIYDTDASTILNSIIQYGRGLIPSWRPDAGNIEVVLAEAFANETADLASFINRLPDSIAEVLLQLYGVLRSDGVKATATATVTMVDTAGYTLPTNTPMGHFTSSGASYVYLTDTDLSVASLSSSGVVGLTAQIIGDSQNTPIAGDALQILSNVPYVSSVVFATAPTGGEPPESDAAYFARTINLLASYTSALTTAAQIQAHVLSTFPTAYRCVTHSQRRQRDRDTTLAGYTTHPGYALVVVAGQNAAKSDTSDVTLGASAISGISTDLDTLTNAGLVVDVMSAELVAITVTSTFTAKAGYVLDDLKTVVSTALDAFLDPNTWDWSSQSVRVNDIIALIDGVAGVDYVTSVSLGAASVVGTSNYTVSTDVSLHNLGTLVVGGTHVLTAA